MRFFAMKSDYHLHAVGLVPNPSFLLSLLMIAPTIMTVVMSTFVEIIVLEIERDFRGNLCLNTMLTFE
jgi:hypothetical protein